MTAEPTPPSCPTRDWARVQLYFIAAVVRLGLFFGTKLPSTLSGRPELTSPLTSFRHFKEGVFLHQLGADPYDGGVFAHVGLLRCPPFTVKALSSAMLLNAHATHVLWTALDLITAAGIEHIYAQRGVKASTRMRMMAIAGFLFNPYTLLSCIGLSTSSLDNCLLALALASASAGHASCCAILAALSIQLSPYSLLLVPPLVLDLNRSCHTKARRFWAVFVLSLAATTCLPYTTLSTSALGASNNVLTTLRVPFLTPNVGMWWYFVTEMFDHFRPFFLGVFQMHLLVYALPICLRLRSDPLFAAFIQIGTIAVWKSYPTLGDMALWTGLLGCFPEVLPNLRHPLFSLAVNLYTAILLPLLHSLWLLTGTGNANFFYAATMVHGLNASLAIVDVLGAFLRSRVRSRMGALEKQAEQSDLRVVQLLSGEM